MSHSSDQNKKEVERLLKTVVDGGYCIGCGACAVVKDSPITMTMNSTGRFQASMDAADASDAKVLEVCPFSEKAVNEDVIGKELFGHDSQYDPKIGYHRKTYAGFVSEGNFRDKGSSGGMGTWLICELFDKKLIDYAIHVHDQSSKGDSNKLFGFTISSSVEEFKKGAKSRYYPVEMSEVLKIVKDKPGRYVIVGVPCFIKSIRLLARQDATIKDRIKFCIGIVCGHLKSSRFAEMFAWQCGIEPGHLKYIDFRKKVPGQNANKYGVEVVGEKDGKEVRVTRSNFEFYGYLWGQGFFKYEACDYCDDVLAETADVTVGDAWLPAYVQDSQGTNVVVVRNGLIGQLIEEGLKSARLNLDLITPDDVAKSQDAGLRHRREGLSFRLLLKDRVKLWRPPKRVPAKEDHLSAQTKKIHIQRIKLARGSHDYYAKARQANDFQMFKRAMDPLIQEYNELYKPQASGSIVQKMKNFVRKIINAPAAIKRLLRDFKYFLNHKHLKGQKKIIYAITPPPRLKNIGDQAQAVAIQKWFAKNYAGLPVFEIDKDNVKEFIRPLKWLVGPDDLIFLHSGGNLGDRGKWSEEARRLIIQSFPLNQVVSLPQTIHFSDSENGRKQKEISRKIYGAHPNLTVIGRDPQSGELADQLFTKARTFSMPDFVLSLPPLTRKKTDAKTKVLLCLRKDNESIFTPADHQALQAALPYESKTYDTTIDQLIPLKDRENVVNETLQMFLSYDAVVTDRYHGLIFAVIGRRPTVVMRTVDHKLTSALSWFKDIKFIKFATDPSQVPALLEEVLKVQDFTVPDWNKLYFDRLPQMLVEKKGVL